LKIADVQILFYAIDPASENQSVAARWLEDSINGQEPLGFTWPTIHQFLRLGTNPAFPGFMSDDEALGWVDEWLEAGVEVVPDADLGWDLLTELVRASPRALRNAIDDAYLAATAISRGATLASFDSDFEAFVGCLLNTRPSCFRSALRIPIALVLRA
jgi:predicted nucleic acid-binding protein